MKNIEKRIVAVFDFDGTLTEKDTLLEFIKFACGRWHFYVGFLLFSPLLMMMLLHIIPNWKVKEMIFSYFFCGWRYSRFQSVGKDFAKIIDTFRRDSILNILKQHIADGHDVYVISASIEEWVEPYCNQFYVKSVLGTKVEVDASGNLTGKFLTRNCYGKEKVHRLIEIESDRLNYFLYAYGDSRGDKELIDFSDIGIYC